eukprot:747364-Prorocentrum_lima.AAC.1
MVPRYLYLRTTGRERSVSLRARPLCPSNAERRADAPRPVNESKGEVLPGATLTGKPRRW